MNNFKTNENNLLARYLLKLAPDFSVFDIAEKYLSENNSNLIFYKGIGTQHNTNFRRAMFKLEDADVNAVLTNGNDLTYSQYSVGNCSYLIVLNDAANIELTFDRSVEIIGAAF